MKRTRFLLILSALLVMVLAFTGCGQDDAGEEIPEDVSEEIEVSGDTPRERAISAIEQMNLPEGTSVRIFGEDLSIRGALIPKEQFEEETGVELELVSAPAVEQFTKIMQDAVNQTGNYDLVYIMQPALGDADQAGYLYTINAFVEKYDPELDDIIANEAFYTIGDRIVALPSDGDAFIFFYRKDLLEDPEEQAAFEAEYGYPLDVPQTWDQFYDVASFFTRPDEDLYGAQWWRTRGFNYWWFFQRLFSLGGRYFDEDMNPGINSPEGVKALEDMIAVNETMPPGALGAGFIESFENYLSGRTFAMISWPVVGRAGGDPELSEIVGKQGHTVVPGYEVDGEVAHRSMNGPGMALAVTSHADNPELAYLVMQYLTSPEIHKQAVLDTQGNHDPARASFYQYQEAQEFFPTAPEYLQAHQDNFGPPVGVMPLAIPGFNEYVEALEAEITAAYAGDVTPQEALDNAANQWNIITNKYGVDRQKERYEAWRESAGEGH